MEDYNLQPNSSNTLDSQVFQRQSSSGVSFGKGKSKRQYQPVMDTATTRKIVLLGNSGVGKTSIIRRFVYNANPGKQKPTVGAQEHTKQIYIQQHSAQINVQIWDVSGQDKFRALTNMYYRDADAAILVCDTMDKESFTSMKKIWFKDLKDKAPENIIISVVGTKTDLNNNSTQEQVSYKDLQEFSQSKGIKNYHTISAKQNKGLSEVFNRIAEQMLFKIPNSRAFNQLMSPLNTSDVFFASKPHASNKKSDRLTLKNSQPPRSSKCGCAIF